MILATSDSYGSVKEGPLSRRMTQAAWRAWQEAAHKARPASGLDVRAGRRVCGMCRLMKGWGGSVLKINACICGEVMVH